MFLILPNNTRINTRYYPREIRVTPRRIIAMNRKRQIGFSWKRLEGQRHSVDSLIPSGVTGKVSFKTSFFSNDFTHARRRHWEKANEAINRDDSFLYSKYTRDTLQYGISCASSKLSIIRSLYSTSGRISCFSYAFSSDCSRLTMGIGFNLLVAHSIF